MVTAIVADVVEQPESAPAAVSLTELFGEVPGSPVGWKITSSLMSEGRWRASR
jgi:hypothetical protein